MFLLGSAHANGELRWTSGERPAVLRAKRPGYRRPARRSGAAASGSVFRAGVPGGVAGNLEARFERCTAKPVELLAAMTAAHRTPQGLGRRARPSARRGRAQPRPPPRPPARAACAPASAPGRWTPRSLRAVVGGETGEHQDFRLAVREERVERGREEPGVLRLQHEVVVVRRQKRSTSGRPRTPSTRQCRTSRARSDCHRPKLSLT